jgi:hypothetical protein
MPGPVSDSYDPEFGTGENARMVKDEIESCIRAIGGQAGLRSRKPILEVLSGPAKTYATVTLSRRSWRAVRFALHRALETL